jgi:formylglycine-generating enzyme required for sulfatase activity
VPYTLPHPGTMVLLLGDLGCLARKGATLRRFWRNWGRRLRGNQNPAVALVPAQARDIPSDLARVWTIVHWGVPAATTVILGHETASALRRLLALISPVVRLEPGLLRAIRYLDPQARQDPGLESRVWQDDAIASPHSVAATLDPEQRAVYQQRFSQLPEAQRRQVLEVIRNWRAHVNETIWFEEIADLDAHSQQELIEATDRQDAERFFASLKDRVSLQSSLPVEIEACFRRMVRRFSVSGAHNAVITRAFHFMLNRTRLPDTVVDVPVWYDPANVPSSGASIHKVELWQVADQVCLCAVDPLAADGLRPVDRGSMLGRIETVSGEVPLAMGQPEPAALSTSWTNSIGMEFVLIPAGTFTMGSPEDEAGRYRDEGPQHQVRISESFYLAKYPVTQAQWEAVMGNNPSHFKGANRPVETVSWEDAQAFIDKLNGREGVQKYRLPTEAQWECACRAGTETPRYHEDLEAIAWYGDNSGGETHDVGEKEPNAWGLYDTLGNIVEWCYDGIRVYTEALEVDPMGPTEADADRVIRGGYWSWGAQEVRAALRSTIVPGFRNDSLGFRYAISGQAS